MVDMKMKKAICFVFSKSHHFYFLLFTGCLTSKLFFQDSCFCIFAKVCKNKAVMTSGIFESLYFLLF